MALMGCSSLFIGVSVENCQNCEFFVNKDVPFCKLMNTTKQPSHFSAPFNPPRVKNIEKLKNLQKNSQIL